MHFPQYWARGEWNGMKPDGAEWHQLAWDYSDESPAHAQSRANDKARRLGESALRTEASANAYPYADRPVREPVLRTLDDAGAECAAVITRTAYGSEVLNTERLMFVDVDLPGPDETAVGFFAGLKRLLGGESFAPTTRAATLESCLSLLTQWQAGNPSWTFRAYRTHSGLRYIVTSAWQDPLSDLTHKVLTALGCDARYQQLCKVQKSFRARLTPKPFRCGCDNPPVSFPYGSAERETLMSQWIAAYQQIAGRFATCQFLSSIGTAPPSSTIGGLIAEHDVQTKATSNLPLA
jgi:hypothetical protein